MNLKKESFLIFETGESIYIYIDTHTYTHDQIFLDNLTRINCRFYGL